MLSKVYTLMNDDDTVFYIFSTEEKAEEYLKKIFLPVAAYDDFLDSYYDPKLNPHGFYEGNGEEYFIVEHPLDPEGGVHN